MEQVRSCVCYKCHFLNNSFCYSRLENDTALWKNISFKLFGFLAQEINTKDSKTACKRFFCKGSDVILYCFYKANVIAAFEINSLSWATIKGTIPLHYSYPQWQVSKHPPVEHCYPMLNYTIEVNNELFLVEVQQDCKLSLWKLEQNINWKRVGKIPGQHAMIFVVGNDCLYVSYLARCIPYIYKYDVKYNTWSMMTEIPLFKDECPIALAYCNNCLYVFLRSFYSEHVGPTWKFDIIKRVWSVCSTRNSNNLQELPFVWKNKIIVRWANEYQGYCIDMYDTKTNQWTYVTQINLPLSELFDRQHFVLVCTPTQTKYLFWKYGINKKETLTNKLKKLFKWNWSFKW